MRPFSFYFGDFFEFRGGGKREEDLGYQVETEMELLLATVGSVVDCQLVCFYESKTHAWKIIMYAFDKMIASAK